MKRILAGMKILITVIAVLAIQAARGADRPPVFVYVGTYTNFELLNPPRQPPAGEPSKGIYVFRFDPEAGTLAPLGVAAEAKNPTFMAFHPTRPVAYSVNELYQFDGQPTGAVSAYTIDLTSGKLSLLNQVSAHSTGPCYVSVDPTGRNVLVATFGGGAVMNFPTEAEGRLKAASVFVQHAGKGPTTRQSTPHAHSINLTPDHRFAVAADFSADQLVIYRFDPVAGSLAANDPPFVALKSGSAPRHFAFAPNGKFAYVLSEISSIITVLAFDGEKGAFRELQTISTLPADFTGFNTAAEVQVHPSGKYLYASNRGHNSIAMFRIDDQGHLSAATHVPVQGRTPRNFSLDPEGRWLIAANQDTNNVVVFRINPETGVLEPTGQVQSVPAPLLVRFWKPIGMSTP